MPKIKFGFQDDERVTLTVNGVTRTQDRWGYAPDPVDEPIQAFGGEVNVLFDPLVAVSAGKLTQRADGKVTLNLTKHRDAQTITGTLANGQTVRIAMAKCVQNRGVGDGVHYYLPEIDHISITEKGDRHITVYMSEGASAYSRARIATEKGLSGEAAVTGAYLLANPEYGTQAKPLRSDAFDALFTARNGLGKPSTSDWYLFERSYDYPWGNMIEGVKGETELKPIKFGPWGTGARPKINGISTTKDGWKNVVFTGIDFAFLYIRYCRSIMVEDGYMSKRPGSSIKEHQIDHSALATYKETRIVDVRRYHSKDGTFPTVPNWKSRDDRAAGLYGADARNVYMRRCHIDKNAWEYGYDPTSPASNELPQPPDPLSHCLYFSYGMVHLYMEENIIGRGPGNAAQSRGGGRWARNAMLENNFGVSASYGEKADKPTATFVDYYDNVHLGALHMPSPWGGRYAAGPDIFGYRAGSVNNIVAHSADPNDPADRTAKPDTDRAINSAALWKFDDTLVYNWNDTDLNTAGLNTALANQTTFQNYADQFLGLDSPTMREALDHMWLDQVDLAEVIPDYVGWTQAGFGRAAPTRTAATAVRFAADDRLNGFFGPTRFNWTTQDRPGEAFADAVDLDGHYVHDGTRVANYASLTFGAGGELEWSSGKLTVGQILDEGFLRAMYCGQVEIGATTAPLKLHANGGRLGITGNVTKLNLLVDGNAQALLGPNATVPVGRKLTVAGQRCKVGWHGAAANSLAVFGTLEFVAGLQLGVTGTIFQNQFMDAGADVDGAGWFGKIVDYEAMNHSSSSSGNHLWVTHMSGVPAVGEVFQGRKTIGEDGLISRNNITMKSVLGCGVSPIQMFRSGAPGQGEVAPTGTGEIRLKPSAILEAKGFLPGSYDLTGPGVTVINEGATLPAGFTISAGKLVLTVS